MAKVFPGGSTRVPNIIGRDLRAYLSGINTLSGVAGLITEEVMQAKAGWWIVQQRAYAQDVYLKSLQNLLRLRQRIEREFAVEARQETVKNTITARNISYHNLQYLTGGGKPPPTGALKNRGGINLQGTAFRITVVDPTFLVRILKEADKGMRQDLARIASARFEPMIPKILIETFEEVWAGLEDGAFPREYKGGIITQILKKGNFSVTGQSPQGIIVNMRDIFTELGTSADLRDGYHYGALIEQGLKYNLKSNAYKNSKGLFSKFPSTRTVGLRGNTVTLPYSGQPLHSSTYGRYRYWYAMMRGQPFVQYGKIKAKIDSGAWQDTKDARVSFWNSQGKAPQWLLLEYGQTKFKPTIPVHTPGAGTTTDSGIVTPGNITKSFYIRLSAEWTKLVIAAWDEAWQHAQTRVKEKPLSQQSYNPFRKPIDPLAAVRNRRLDIIQDYRARISAAEDAALAAYTGARDIKPFYKSHSKRRGNLVGGLD